MAQNTVKSIEQLYSKIEQNELKRCESGKELSGSQAVFLSELNIMKKSYNASCFDFCRGFLHGLSVLHFLTNDEFHLLMNELRSLHQSSFEKDMEARENEFSSFMKSIKN